MTDVMEKTFASVSGFLLSTVAPRNTDLSPGFSNLVRSVNRARSKSDEEKLVRKELELLKSRLAQPDVSLKKMKEYLVRLMYCEMLGQSASFGYIYALKLAQQGTMINKRVGYLAVSMFLHENHELVLLLINTLQRDLRSTNILDNCMALGVLCKLVSVDMIPAMLPLVEEKMTHPRALVRKKAVMVLHRFYHKAPHLIQHLQDRFKQALCDRDPTVMYAALQMYYDLIQRNPSEQLQLVRPLVGILDQIIMRKLSSDFEFHGVSAPWMQILILKMLAKLGAADERICGTIHGVLDEMFNKANLSQNIAFAVQYECILTVTCVHPTPDLLDKAAYCINKFIKSRNNNLKYLGISALSAILDISPSCAIQHQNTVIDCLDDKDSTIRFKTVQLLYRMTNESNISIVCKKLMAFMSSTKEDFVKRDLVNKIIQLAEKYRPTVRWYVDAMTMLILTGGSNVPTNIVHKIIGALKQDNSVEVRQHTVGLCLPFAAKPNIPETLVQLIAWVIGDCCSLPDSTSCANLLHILCTLLERPYNDDSNTREWVVAAMMKVVAHGKVLPDEVKQSLVKFKMASSVNLRQRINELETLSKDIDFMQSVLSSDDRDLQLDCTLSFLDDYVSDALENGAAPYKPRQQRHMEKQPSPEEVKPIFAGLNFRPYESPASLASGESASISSPITDKDSALGAEAATVSSVTSDKDSSVQVTPPRSVSSDGTGSGKSNEQIEQHGSFSLKLEGVNKVWGQKGYSRPKSSPKRTGAKVKGDRSSDVTSPIVLPGKDGGMASVQMSSAKAVGTTSRQNKPTENSEEDRQKKELARALFGGMQRSMVMSKAPIDRRKQQVLQREENHLIEELTASNQTNLLDGLSISEDSNEQSIEIKQNINSEIDRLLSSSPPNVADDETEFDPIKTSTSGKGETLGLSVAQNSHNPDGNVESNSLSQNDFLHKDSAPSLGATGDTKSLNKLANQKENLLLDTMKNEDAKTDLLGASETEIAPRDKDLLLHDPTNSTTPTNKSDGVTMANVSLLDDSPDDLKDKEQENHLPSDIVSYPHSMEPIELGSDVTVRVTLCKVWKPDRLGLAFFVNNQSQTHDVEDLVLKLDLPSNFKLIQPSELTLDHIPPIYNKCLLVETICNIPALHMSLGGQLTYKDYTKTTKRLFFNSTITIADLLRPKEMNTSEYGQLWPQLTHDHRLIYGKVNMESMSKVMTLVQEKLRLHPVDLIGNEGICSGTLLGTAPCLLHSKLTGQKLDCWVKSTSQLLSDSIAKHCDSIFT